jgi:predicted DCC family thiol-disulfide oxidoreductase YuxK
LKKHQHLILFDDTCSLCWRSIDKIRRWDKKKRFVFSPIRSDTAKEILGTKWEKFKRLESLILIENVQTPKAKIWIKGRAVMRVFWLLGGWRRSLGWLAYAPLGIDHIYSYIAKRRHRF